MEETKLPITNWAEDDKPREKLMLKGKGALSDAELIAILLGSGSRNESAVALSQRILASNENNINVLGKQSIESLMKFKGIGEAKAISIIAALELGKRRQVEEVMVLKSVTSSKIIFNMMQPIIGDLLHEEFWILCLSNANKLLYKTQLSKGGMTGTVVDIRMLFKIAIEHNAIQIVLVHNHPSGKTNPSNADIDVTNKIKTAAKYLDITLLDHVIIGENSYYSFADEQKL
jgi:DNA repair protein RadC